MTASTYRPRPGRTSGPKIEFAVWDVVVSRELRPVIDALAGKRAGYGDAYAQLQRDPCIEYQAAEGTRPFAYRLSGPLEPKVCGVRLKRGYRLAFTMGPSAEKKYQGCVEVLYVGKRDTRDRTPDVWQIVHDLFGVENPPADHLRPRCCDSGLPVLDEQELADFMNALRKFLRGKARQAVTGGGKRKPRQ
jgi:hypothetical protein